MELRSTSSPNLSDTTSLIRHREDGLDHAEEVEEKRINCEQITLIWLDPSIGDESPFSEDIHLTERTLRHLNDYVLLFTNTSECLRHIESIQNETVILIVAGSCASSELMAKMQKVRHVDSVLIFCRRKDRYESLLSKKEYNKLLNIFDEQASLEKCIADLIEQINRQSAIFTLYDPQKQKFTRDPTHESGSFLFLQLIKKVIEKMAANGNAMSGSREEMLEKCRLYYRDNPKELDNIAKFEREYTSDQAIKWYTNNSFIYKLINKALRTEDIEALYTYRFYIIDLCRSLAEHCQMLREYGPKTKLFRGMKMSEGDLERLREGIGKLIVVNGFLSTSRKRTVAKAFAGIGAKTDGASNSSNLQPIIFEIQIDLEQHPNIILADVRHLSTHTDEEEVLFDLGAVFKIRAIKYDEVEKYWKCFMTASDEALDIVKEYYDFKQMESEKTNDIEYTFGNLLHEMGERYKSLNYFQHLLKRRPNDAKIYFGIGRCYHGLSNLADGRSYYMKALELCAEDGKEDQILKGKLCSSLLRAHHDDSDFEKALAFGDRALRIYEEIEGHDHIAEKAKVLIDIGLVHFDLGNDQESFDHLQKALELLQATFSFEHPAISDCLAHLSFAHYHHGNYDAALQCLFKSLEIDQRLLPVDHPNKSAIENNIGKQFYKQGKYNEALKRFVRAAEIDTRNSTECVVVSNNLGKVHYRLGNFDQATHYYDVALKLIDATYSISADHIYRAYTLKNKGEIQLALGNYTGAFELFGQAHQMYQRLFPDQPNHRDLGKCQLLFGRTYLAMGDASKAKEAFDNTLEIWTKGLPKNHPDFALIHQSMADLRERQTFS